MHIRYLVTCFTALLLLVSLAAQPSAPVPLTAAPLPPTELHNISDLSHEEPPLAPLDPIMEPADPLTNDAPSPISAAQHVDINTVDARHAHLAFNFLFRNDGPGDITRLEVYVAVPSDRDNQHITDLAFSAPYPLRTDRYGQPLAYFEFGALAAGQQVTVSWEGLVEIEALDYGLDPGLVGGLDQIPADIVTTYTTNEAMYRLESQVIQDAAQVAAEGATTPYWIARNIHDFVAERLEYVNDHQWDDAETVYLQRHGSCSEYTFLFVALCRANGLPARYVGATRQRSDSVYVDTVFHRWAEVYLPPYGWVPVDVTWDDGSSGPRYDYFGAVADSLFVTTVGGGDSEYLGWNYHYAYRYHWSGDRPDRTRERRFTWTPYTPFEAVVEKSVTPLGEVAFGDTLTYTLVVSDMPGAQLRLYDPLTDTTFLRFVEQPPMGVIHRDDAITGTLTVTPSNRVTISFATQVGVPGTAGWTVTATNRACVYPVGGARDDCVWSNEVSNPASWPHSVHLPLVLRG